MESYAIDSSSGASAHLSQGPPQPVAISSSLLNASPNGGQTSGPDNEALQNGNDEVYSHSKDGRNTRRNRLSVESLTCPSCGKVCSNKSKFMRHRSTHSEDRPYSCGLCKKGFKWVEYLSKHMKQQHPNTSLSSPTEVAEVAPDPSLDPVTSSPTTCNMMGINLLLEGANVNLGVSSTSLSPGHLGNHTAAMETDQQQSVGVGDGVVQSSNTYDDPVLVSDESAEEQDDKCSGKFQDVFQSPAVMVCSSGTNNSSESTLVTTASSNSVTMITSGEPGAYIVTSSFENSHNNKVTFSVPLLKTTEHAAPTTDGVTSFVNQLYMKPTNVLDHSVADSSFDRNFSSNSSFDQGGFPSGNALIVSALSSQVASAVTNTSVQPLDTVITEEDGEVDDSSGGVVVKKYICEHEGCNKTYRYKKDVIRHMKMKHGSQPTRYEQREVSEALLRKHGCSQCDKMYAHRKDLLRHQRDVHSPEAIARREASKGNLKKYPCDQPNCHKLYVHKKDLIRHRRNDHGDSTETKDMHIPNPVSPCQYSSSPAKRHCSTSWSCGSKVISAKAETATEPVSASDVQQWMGVTVVKEGNVTAAVMTTTTDTNIASLAPNCALFNTSPTSSAATSLLSLLNSANQQSLPVDNATAQLIGQSAGVHPLFSAVASMSQGNSPAVSTSST